MSSSDNNRETDPSYGMIRISRAQSGAHSLFGSSIKHEHTIHLEISNGSITRDLNTDWYAEEKPIIQIELSPTQFADAITGIGTAVPCTINWQKDIGVIKTPEIQNKKTQFKEEFDDNVKKSAEQSVAILKRVEELFQKKSLTKADRTEILKQLNKLQSTITSHNTFMADCFNKQVEKTTTEAKGEIEAFWQQKLNDIALASIAQSQKQPELNVQMPKLLENNEENNDEQEKK